LIDNRRDLRPVAYVGGSRERIAAGLPIWYLVRAGVVQYISKRRLYRTPASPF